MTDYNHTDIGSGYNTKTAINTELSAVETAIASKLDSAGDTMSGDLDMDSNRITNLADAVTSQEPMTLSQGLRHFEPSEKSSPGNGCSIMYEEDF